jgi:hypothetical protein
MITYLNNLSYVYREYPICNIDVLVSMDL